MKKKTHKILKITATLGITLAIGSVLAVSNQPQKYEGAHAYVINEENDTLYLSYTDLQYNTFNYLAEKLQDTEHNIIANTTITIEQLNTTTNAGYYENETTEQQAYIAYEGDPHLETQIEIRFNYNNKAKWEIYAYDEEESNYVLTTWTAGITINNAEWFIENLQAPTDTSDIIPTITTGLGLIEDLARQFLAGFTGIFWEETNERLSNVGIFSMVMLGIGITFSVISLCLWTIRNNTGA